MNPRRRREVKAERAEVARRAMRLEGHWERKGREAEEAKIKREEKAAYIAQFKDAVADIFPKREEVVEVKELEFTAEAVGEELEITEAVGEEKEYSFNPFPWIEGGYTETITEEEFNKRIITSEEEETPESEEVDEEEVDEESEIPESEGTEVVKKKVIKKRRSTKKRTKKS
jgi:hypothetical protein